MTTSTWTSKQTRPGSRNLKTQSPSFFQPQTLLPLDPDPPLIYPANTERVDPSRASTRSAMKLVGFLGVSAGFLLAYQRSSCECPGLSRIYSGVGGWGSGLCWSMSGKGGCMVLSGDGLWTGEVKGSRGDMLGVWDDGD
jgi:hypothetical protein